MIWTTLPKQQRRKTSSKLSGKGRILSLQRGHSTPHLKHRMLMPQSQSKSISHQWERRAPGNQVTARSHQRLPTHKVQSLQSIRLKAIQKQSKRKLKLILKNQLKINQRKMAPSLNLPSPSQNKSLMLIDHQVGLNQRETQQSDRWVDVSQRHHETTSHLQQPLELKMETSLQKKPKLKKRRLNPLRKARRRTLYERQQQRFSRR